MRRETFEKGGGGIPFAENLVFYAPLTKGDLTDHVSGNNAELCTDTSNNAQTSIVWDYNYNMYRLFTKGDNYAYNYPFALRWNVPNLFDTDKSYTIAVKMQVLQETSNGYFAYFACSDFKKTFNNRTETDYVYTYAHQSRNTKPTTLSWVICSLSRGADHTARWYLNSLLKTTRSPWCASKTIKPDTIALCQKHHNTTSCEMLAKDLIVYDRLLNQTEIELLCQYGD